ncbi:MAG: tetratricopeptide repeat protein [Syntrophobacteraceae bacterium]|nr:tetratricopeptide repeat protein [Syntrophobacteraceae bacterium]
MRRGTGFHVLCAVALLLSAACATFKREPSSKYSAEQLQEMGEKFLSAGSLPQALKLLTLAEAKRPKDPMIQYDLATAYDRRGLSSEALAHYQKALALKPDFPEALNALGAFYAARGQYDLAEPCFQKALANPFYETPYLALFNLGLLYEKKGDIQTALKHYQQAVRLQPAYGPAYYRMGEILEGLRRGDEAREAYGKAITYNPDMVEAHYRYGVMSYMAGELENAFYSLSRVVRLAPHSSMATDSKKYLEQLQTLTTDRRKPLAAPTSEKVAQLEVMAEQEVMQQQTRVAVAPSIAESTIPASSTPPIPAESPSAGVIEEPKQEKKAPTAPAKPARPSGKVSPSDKEWTYIVQVGSFLDKDNAEILLRRLKEKGYDAVLKNFNHQFLGSVYVVQLKPVEEAAKASTLLAQVENEEQQIKPIIIKVPSNL